MFTGIVCTIGTVTSAVETRDGLRLTVESGGLAPRVRTGSSVSVSGVCLTVSRKQGRGMMFDVMEATLKKTTIGTLKKGDRVNLEPSLRIGDEMGGHVVYGHVDAIGEIEEIKKLRNSRLMRCGLPKNLKKYIVPQGSVAIDGVSLTVARVGKNDFSVSLVPYTLRHTTLGCLKKGDWVHIECDMMAKYVIEGWRWKTYI